MTDDLSDATASLVAYAAAARRRPLPDDVREATRLHLLDTLAAIVSGSGLSAGIAGRRYALTTEGRPSGSLLGTGASSDPVSAAIANGMSAHADESDDSHETSLTHPGCGILPAALVAAELTPSSGTELENALALGYDVTGRFGEVLCDVMSPFRSSLATHAWGPLFGAGFAAGSLSRFDDARFVTLLSYLIQEASGVTTWTLDQQHVLKSYVFGGMPAGGAIRALRFTQLGFSGSGDVLDPGRRNLLDALGIDTTRAAHLAEGLGERWIMRETDIKSHPIGYPLIAPVSVVERMVREEGVRAEDVTAVRVHYHPDWYTVTARSPMPDVNLPHCLAATLIDGRLTFAASHDESRMADPAVLALRERISLLGPVEHLGRFDVRVEIELGDRTVTGEQVGDVLGRASNPMSRDQVEAKARELLEPVLGAGRTTALISATRDLDRVADVRELIAAARPLDAAPASGA
jgi:2-methylcitrate dehydratase PrpD